DSIEVRELQIQRNQDATFNLLKSITGFVELIKKDLIILQNENQNLEKRNLELEKNNSTLEKKILELGREILRLSTDNVKLKEVISTMEESRSWKITKPLRLVKHVPKKLK
nr:hypothetical protein [Caldisericia bacterium]